VSPSEYADRYPELADLILEAFPALEVMEGLKPGSADGTASVDERAEAVSFPQVKQLGEYRILREIGHGGMGVVYEALQESLGRRVALKILPFHGRVDPVQIERFRLESRSAARLHHGNIVPVYGVGEHEGIYYYAMQYIQGHGLDVILGDLKRLKNGVVDEKFLDVSGSVAVARSLLTGRFESGRQSGADPSPVRTLADGHADRSGAAQPVAASSSVLSRSTETGFYRTVARVGVQVAQALAHAHGQGVLHRDIKPSNLLLDIAGHVWVTDFGLAKLEGSEGPTQTGDILGTLRYMAPERFEGWSDRRGDIYGLGMTLYEMLTLRPAFDAATRAKLIEQVIHEPPPPPRKLDRQISRDLETIVLKAIAKEPAERYATAEAMGADLEHYLADRPIVARRSSLPERAWRWCRRNKAAAALLAASGITVLSLFGVAVGLVDNARVRSSEHRAVAARQVEEQERKKAEAAVESEERLRYFDSMLLAQREWLASNVGRSEQILDQDCPVGHRGWEWHYLKRMCHTDLLTLAHPGYVWDIAFSPDGSRIASASMGSPLVSPAEAGIRLWDAARGTLIQDLGGHSGNDVGSVAFSPDGTLLASASGNHQQPGEVKIWNASTGKELNRFRGVTGYAARVQFSPDGKRLAAVSGEWDRASLLTVWEVKTGDILRTIVNPKGNMHFIGLAFSPDGKRIATATGKMDYSTFENEQGVVTIWDSWTGREIHTLSGHRGPLTSVVCSPDGTKLATSSWDQTVKVWDAMSGTELLTFRGHAQATNRVIFSPDSRRIASASEDNSVIIWNARTGEILLTLRGHAREVEGLCFRPDGQRLASSDNGGTIKVWDAVEAKEARTLRGHTEWVNGVDFSPDGRQVASASIDRTVRVWDLVTGRSTGTIAELSRPALVVEFSPDGSLIAAGGGNWKEPETPGEVQVVEVATGKRRYTCVPMPAW
jgi:WD40 repeat protein/serine/threonine protein kinase